MTARRVGGQLQGGMAVDCLEVCRLTTRRAGGWLPIGVKVSAKSKGWRLTTRKGERELRIQISVDTSLTPENL